MASCTRCGATMEGLDAGGNMLCDNCEAAMHSAGSGTDVPCQRCGMYLPSHELQMWNSRLYCSYCIMDLRDEEKMGREQKKPEGESPQPQGGLFSGLFGGRETDSQPPLEKGAGESQQQYPHTAPGICERCGREADALYIVGGRKLCQICISSGGVSGSGPGFFAQIVSAVKRAAGIKPQPKIIAQQPTAVFDLRTRKMMEKTAGEARAISAQEEKEQALSEDRAYGEPPAPPQEVFDVSGRKFEDKKVGIDAEQPISEGANEEKKPSQKTKKLFFKLHPSGGGMAKKK